MAQQLYLIQQCLGHFLKPKNHSNTHQKIRSVIASPTKVQNIMSFLKHYYLQRFRDPKNYIYNAIRRAAKDLAKYEQDVLGRDRRLISRDTLLSLLEIANQVQKEIIANSLTLNEDCLLFVFKKGLLKFALWQDSLNDQQKCGLVRLIKMITLKVRCLSIFKRKSRKNWKLSKRALLLISSFDKVCHEGYEKFELDVGADVCLSVEVASKNSEVEEESILGFPLSLSESFFVEEAGKKWRAEVSLEDEVNQILNISKSETNIPSILF